MDYAHSRAEAGAYAEAALSLMQEREIPSNPNNFTLWYGYFSGDFPDLKQALDILLSSSEHITEEISAQIFRKFCAHPLEAVPLHLIAEKMETEVATAVVALEQACRNAATYNQSLELAHGQMSQVPNMSGLINLMTALLTQTRAMAHQSRDVERQLRQSWSEVTHLREQLEGARREAMTDALTGLANRKMFDFVLRESAAEAMETHEPLSLLLLDIDHFKVFNDTYGHHVGDQVLKLLASVLRESLKGQDTAARYGGEEFAVLLPRTEIEDAAKVAEKIRQRVAGKVIIHRKSQEQLGRVNVSIGVAMFAFGEPLRRFVERSDRALYRAKRSGRNCVVTEMADEQNQVALGH
jgi:diguanylate cyclase